MIVFPSPMSDAAMARSGARPGANGDTTTISHDDASTTLCVVVPAYNEQEVLHALHARVSAVLRALPFRWQVLYVNDGSRDSTGTMLLQLAEQDPHVAVLELSRNFGKEIALSAGLDHAETDLVIVIDADLQDPPELIPQLIDGWRQGYDVVYAQRLTRAGESWFKRATASAFYRLVGRVSHVKIPRDTGDFRLLTRRAVLAVRQLREQHRFMKGIFTWVGFPQLAVPYHRDARQAGTTKWNYWKLWNFALEGITSFSTAPLKLATYGGLASALFSFAYGIYMVIDTLLFGNRVPGYPSLMTVMLFLGGLQLMAIGVVGEYVGRMFDEVKGRPLYLLKTCRVSPAPQPAPAATATHPAC